MEPRLGGRCYRAPMDRQEGVSSARRIQEERVLEEAGHLLGAHQIEPLFSDDHKVPRYLHARVRLSSVPELLRLKVVNPMRSDAAQIGPCCRVSNAVHRGLNSLSRDFGFQIPYCHPVPEALHDRLYVVEEIAAAAPHLMDRDDVRCLISGLLGLEQATRDFDLPFGAKPQWINSCNRSGYLENLTRSLDSVCARNELSWSDRNRTIDAFNHHWPAGPLDSARCLSHGDCSAGNVRADGTRMWLIDFEHSHVGAPVLDVAHLFVNLLCDGASQVAQMVREQYWILRRERGLPKLPGVFEALALERVAGKWNAMSSSDAERRSRIRALLEIGVVGTWQ